MNITIGAALLGGGVLLFWVTIVGTRLARPPFWTSDTMVMCFITPLALLAVALGTGILVYAATHASLRATSYGDLEGFAIVVALCIALGWAVARWSRRAPRKAAAEVLPLQQPEAPEPPNPLPTIGGQRRAA
jgi:hypothetical protein